MATMNETGRLYLDIHVLQTLPPSCVNRDDVGMPKSCIYGGVQRARVSSQAWKHAVRGWFREHGVETGVRSRSLTELLAGDLRDRCGMPEDEAEARAKNVMVKVLKVAADTSAKGKEDKKGTIAFMSMKQIRAIADLINNDPARADKADAVFCNEALKAAQQGASSDILLFGRMYADNIDLNVDAAAEVAHAVSTHQVQQQYDYFSAVEDFGHEGDAGAGHIGSKVFNSATVYRYATVNLGEKSELIRFDRVNAAHIARNFLEAFVLSMPTGSVNSYANNSLPFYVETDLRTDMPVSFMPAFERAVHVDRDLGGYESPSRDALEAYEENIDSFYGGPADRAVLGREMAFDALLAHTEEKIGQLLLRPQS
jgi:CRISPR system Cascade subunit CasC